MIRNVCARVKVEVFHIVYKNYVSSVWKNKKKKRLVRIYEYYYSRKYSM